MAVDNVVALAKTRPFKLLVVDPGKLHDIWPRIRDGLLKVIEATSPEWIPEDVYDALRNRRATLLVAEDTEWFIVAQQQPRHTGSCLMIWVLYAPGDYKKFAGLVYPELEQLAREIGANRLEMHSPRKGWERDPRWIMRETIFTREVKAKA